VGISFYTFQTLSYSIDVYQDRQRAERHLGHFALYVSFFPQLVAGPIERFSRLAPQLRQHHTLQWENVQKGLRLILFGLFTKMVIADNFAPLVDEVYADPMKYGSSGVGSAMLFYSFQIYGDFFGYSLIAIGSARIMGISLMDNFKTPYLATGIADFWQRWHISLSTWFRDYLFLPLGGSRVKVRRWVLNILIVFLVSGFWHGANFTFLFWGLIFAVAYLLEKALSHFRQDRKAAPFLSLGHVVRVSITFLIVTCAWVFFRSSSLDQAFDMFDILFHSHAPQEAIHEANFNWTLLLIFVLVDFALFNRRFDEWIDDKPVWVRWTSYTLLLFSIFVFSAVEDHAFIYFQF
jgi:D-alanyl-lipoteichoic acid acyltransferase DltB (MBOAT superfamily)